MDKKPQDKLVWKNKYLYNETLEILKKYDPDVCQEIMLKDIMSCNRKFRADFYCPKLKLIVEINGGEFKDKSRHTWGYGYQNDLTKCNIIQLCGFKCLQYTYHQLQKNTIEDDMKILIENT